MNFEQAKKYFTELGRKDYKRLKDMNDVERLEAVALAILNIEDRYPFWLYEKHNALHLLVKEV